MTGRIVFAVLILCLVAALWLRSYRQQHVKLWGETQDGEDGCARVENGANGDVNSKRVPFRVAPPNNVEGHASRSPTKESQAAAAPTRDPMFTLLSELRLQ
jgi:hypothetical protein